MKYPTSIFANRTVFEDNQGRIIEPEAILELMPWEIDEMQIHIIEPDS